MSERTLSEFLLARIAEDEAPARYAMDLDEEFPVPNLRYGWARFWGRGSHGFAEGAPSPARVLAECEAKRLVVAEHQWLPGFRVHDRGECRTCGWARGESCPTLLHLAAVYADHPDYRDEWKP